MLSGAERAHACPLGMLVLLALASCGDSPTRPPDPPANRAPTIGAIADRTVIRNTLAPRGVEVALDVQDEDDDSVTVRLDSDAGDLIPGMSFTCALHEPCVLTFTPAPHRTAAVNLQVTVSDARGGEASTSFVVELVPLLVTDPGDQGAGSLRDVATAAEPGDVIGFDTDGAFREPRTIVLQDQIVLDRSLIVEGPGAEALTLSGGDAVRVFRISDGADVLVRGLRLADGRAPVEELYPGALIAMGGGILVDVGSRLTLAASTVTGNVAESPDAFAAGGGIGNFGGVLLVLESSRIERNAAREGGGIAAFGPEASGAETRIENSIVTDNTAQFAGGVYTNGDLVVDASAITANHADGEGGGLVNEDGTAVVRNGSVVSGNSASAGGGIYNSVGALTIADSEVFDNTAETRGGAVINFGQLQVSASRFAGNRANGENPFTDGGGALMNTENGTALIAGSMIEGNEAVARGGGVRNGGRLEIVADTRVAGNAADVGGGLANQGVIGNATMANSTLEGNAARLGAGVFNADDLVLEASRIADNLASQHGGGLYHSALSAQATTLVTGSTIEGNEAPRGGGVYVIGNGLEIADSRLLGNVGLEDGGGLYFHGRATSDPTIVTIGGSTFERNAAGRGGGIFFDVQGGATTGVAHLVLQAGSRVLDNTALEGGGLYQTQTFGVSGATRTTIHAGTFEENAASLGGGILHEGGRITFQGASLIAGNLANYGGGLYSRVNALPSRETTTTLEDVNVSGNEATLLGGGVYNEGTLNVLEGATITNNTANGPPPAGGGIYNDAGVLNNEGDVSGNAPDDVVVAPA